MIRTDALTKRYNSTLALDRLSLEVPDGTVFGLLGPNGAGKTTFLRLVMGFIQPDAGSIHRGDLPPARIGYLPERAFYPPRFSIRDFLAIQGRLAGLRGPVLRGSVDRLLHLVGLRPIASRRLGACSRGMLQRLGLAQALLGDPPLLLLDEPVLGLDPAAQKFMREQILALHQAGKTIILCSHHLDEVTRICTDIAVINRGSLVRSGALHTILAPRAEVSIVTGPLPPELTHRLVSLDPDIRVAEAQVTLSGPAASRKSEVLHLLLHGGADIQQLSVRHVTLEEVYLEATGE